MCEDVIGNVCANVARAIRPSHGRWKTADFAETLAGELPACVDVALYGVGVTLPLPVRTDGNTITRWTVIVRALGTTRSSADAPEVVQYVVSLSLMIRVLRAKGYLMSSLGGNGGSGCCRSCGARTTLGVIWPVLSVASTDMVLKSIHVDSHSFSTWQE